MRRASRSVLLAVLLVTGCSPTYGGLPIPIPGGPYGDVVVVGGRGGGPGHKVRGARRLHIPPGHYPPPGMCRIWYPGHPPGHQPPPAPCGRLIGRVPYGTLVLYNDRQWDTRYDWWRRERHHRGSVPAAILDLMLVLVR